MIKDAITETIERVIHQFCVDFLNESYLCYTEHGLHALFYTMLYNALLPELRYTTWQGHKVCVIQKEYPTAGMLGKPRRQHWDIAVIKTPPQSLIDGSKAYDYLRLASVVEFGLNEGEEHIRDDIERLSHTKANTDKGYVVHLYRLSRGGVELSGRDLSSDSAQICSIKQVAGMVKDKPVEVYYGVWDSTGKHKIGLWQVKGTQIKELQ